MKVGYAFVVADLLHVGHLRFLRKCKEYCDFLIVGVYTDKLTATYKRKPIIPFEERIELVKALKPVDMVAKVQNRDCSPMLRKLSGQGWKISYLFHGDDWSVENDEDLRKSKECIESLGGKLILTPYHHGQSSTKIIQKIQNRGNQNE